MPAREVPPIRKEALSEEGARVYDLIAANVRTRAVTGPFAILMHQPALAEGVFSLGMGLRQNSVIGKKLLELVVLVVARRYRARYQWHAHHKSAIEAGISADAVERIRTRRAPQDLSDDEQVVYELVTELGETRTLSDDSYDRGVDTFGLTGMIELVTAVGFYSLIATTLHVFEAPVPDDAPTLP